MGGDPPSVGSPAMPRVRVLSGWPKATRNRHQTFALTSFYYMASVDKDFKTAKPRSIFSVTALLLFVR